MSDPDFSCPDCAFDPDDSLVMCKRHDDVLRLLSLETLRAMMPWNREYPISRLKELVKETR